MVNLLLGSNLCHETGFVSALKDELEQFVSIETKKLQDAKAEEAIDRVRKKQIGVESLVNQWTNAFTKVGNMQKHPPTAYEELNSFVYIAITMIHIAGSICLFLRLIMCIIIVHISEQ